MSKICAVPIERTKRGAGAKLLVTKLYGCNFLPHVEISFYQIKVADDPQFLMLSKAVIVTAPRPPWFQNSDQTSHFSLYPKDSLVYVMRELCMALYIHFSVLNSALLGFYAI
jgi:hypothetical protein